MENTREVLPEVKIVEDSVYITYSCTNPVMEKLRNFKQESLFCDVVLQSETTKVASEFEVKNTYELEELNAHSCILATGSTLFQTSFMEQSQWKNIYCISGVGMGHLKICVDFIYRMDIEFPQNELDNVLKASKMLKIPDLEKMCFLAETNILAAQSVNPKSKPSTPLNFYGENYSDIEHTTSCVPTEDNMQNLNNSLESTESFVGVTFSDFNSKQYGSEGHDDSNNIGSGSAAGIIDETEDETMSSLKNPVRSGFEASILDENDEEANSLNKSTLENSLQQPILKREVKPIKESDNDRTEKSFYCCHCKEVFSLAKHYCSVIKKTLRLRMMYTCQICGEKVSSANLNKHRKKHSPQNEKKQIFIIKKNVSGKIYYCDFCKKEFTSGYHFCSSRNKKIRIRLKYVCHLCGKDVLANTFTAHMKMHETPNKYACEYKYCGFVGEFQRELASHMLIHSTGKKFTCDVCGKNYKGPHSLREHKFKVHNILKDRKQFKNDVVYKCPDCDFESYSSRMVTFHMLKEHRNSKSGFVKQCISLYQKKKRKAMKNDANMIPEFESLKMMLKKNEKAVTSSTNDLKTTDITSTGTNDNGLNVVNAIESKSKENVQRTEFCDSMPDFTDIDSAQFSDKLMKLTEPDPKGFSDTEIKCVDSPLHNLLTLQHNVSPVNNTLQMSKLKQIYPHQSAIKVLKSTVANIASNVAIVSRSGNSLYDMVKVKKELKEYENPLHNNFEIIGETSSVTPNTFTDTEINFEETVCSDNSIISLPEHSDLSCDSSVDNQVNRQVSNDTLHFIAQQNMESDIPVIITFPSEEYDEFDVNIKEGVVEEKIALNTGIQKPIDY